jgi:hypothetical protein
LEDLLWDEKLKELIELDQKQERNLQFCFSVCTPAKRVALEGEDKGFNDSEVCIAFLKIYFETRNC